VKTAVAAPDPYKGDAQFLWVEVPTGDSTRRTLVEVKISDEDERSVREFAKLVGSKQHPIKEGTVRNWCHRGVLKEGIDWHRQGLWKIMIKASAAARMRNYTLKSVD
jgi:hypothetical protein